MADSLIARYFKSLPIAFPLIGLFHIVMTIVEGYFFLGDPSIHSVYYYRPALLLLYTILWLLICIKKRWAGIAYLVLTLVNMSLQLFGNDKWLIKRALGDVFYEPLPINLVFCFLILFYYRKLK